MSSVSSRESRTDGSAVLRAIGAARMLSMAVEESIESAIRAELAGDRLSPSQWKLLEIFALSAASNVTEVAAFLSVSTAAASKAVDRLVRLGLMSREEDHEDRRHIRLTLSVDGKRLVEDYLQRLDQRTQELFRHISPDQLDQITDHLETLAVAALRGASSLDRVCLQCGLQRRDTCILEERLGATCLFRSHHRSPMRSHSGQPVGH